jgi:hypothetical protein
MATSGLGPIPSTYRSTRESLHLVAARVLGAARFLAVGKMGLMIVPGGFGTPEFNRRRVMVTNGELSDGRRRRSFTTLCDACEFAGIDPTAELHPVLAVPASPDVELPVDAEAFGVLSRWFALGQSALCELTATSAAGEEASPIQLWPEHFDLALEMGSPESRANYGASPGDETIDEPYLYVGPHRSRQGRFWNSAFGAALTFSQVHDGADPVEFLLRGRGLLSSATAPD